MEHKPWTLHRLSDGCGSIGVIDSDENGFIRDQILECSPLKTMNFQFEDDFPKCQGVNRIWTEEKMYPQYGNLRGPLFGRGRLVKKNYLQIERKRLLTEIGNDRGIEEPRCRGRDISTDENRAQGHIGEGIAASMREHLRELEKQRRERREARRAQRRQPDEEENAGNSTSSCGQLNLHRCQCNGGS